MSNRPITNEDVLSHKLCDKFDIGETQTVRLALYKRLATSAESRFFRDHNIIRDAQSLFRVAVGRKVPLAWMIDAIDGAGKKTVADALRAGAPAEKESLSCCAALCRIPIDFTRRLFMHTKSSDAPLRFYAAGHLVRILYIATGLAGDVLLRGGCNALDVIGYAIAMMALAQSSVQTVAIQQFARLLCTHFALMHDEQLDSAIRQPQFAPVHDKIVWNAVNLVASLVLIALFFLAARGAPLRLHVRGAVGTADGVSRAGALRRVCATFVRSDVLCTLLLESEKTALLACCDAFLSP
jgi:hypothetical protein